MGELIKIDCDQPNEYLIKTFKDLLKMAESGELRTFVGTGFLKGESTVTIQSIDQEASIFKLLGTVTNLQLKIANYIED